MLLEAKIVEQKKLAADIFLLRIMLPAPSGISTFHPGQFAMVNVSESHDPLLNRPFSISHVNTKEGWIDILYRLRGKGTYLLSRKRPGEPIKLIAPLGQGFPPLEEMSVPLILVAGGMGIAPLISLASAAVARHVPFSLLWGVKRASELIDFNKAMLPEFPRNTLHTASEDGIAGLKGTALDLFERHVRITSPKRPSVFACGPLGMLRSLYKQCATKEFPLFVSLETRMACGLGYCQGCAVPSSAGGYLKACIDGPVLHASRINWEKIHAAY